MPQGLWKEGERKGTKSLLEGVEKGGGRGLWEKREGRGRRPKGNRKGKERSKSVIGMGRHKWGQRDQRLVGRGGRGL